MVSFSSGEFTSAVQRVRKTITLDGTAALGQAGTAVPLFTVTGEVLVHVAVGFCTTTLTQAMATATVSLGTVTNVEVFIAATTSTDLSANDWWASTTPTPGSIDATGSVETVFVSENIILDPLTQDTDAGVIEVTILWEALSDDGNVVAA